MGKFTEETLEGSGRDCLTWSSCLCSTVEKVPGSLLPRGREERRIEHRSVCVCLCVLMSEHVCAHVRMCVHVCACVCMCVRVCVHVCACVHAWAWRPPGARPWCCGGHRCLAPSWLQSQVQAAGQLPQSLGEEAGTPLTTVPQRCSSAPGPALDLDQKSSPHRGAASGRGRSTREPGLRPCLHLSRTWMDRQRLL